jgi:hypothetical protein
MEAIAERVKTDDAERVPLALEPRCVAVRSDQVPYLWPRVGKWVRWALDDAVNENLNIQDVYRRCLSGEFLMVTMQIGDELAGVAVLDYSIDPRGEGYVLVACCGGERMPLWIGEFIATVRRIANERGARRVLMVGRRGWQPILEQHGARLKCICMGLEV